MILCISLYISSKKALWLVQRWSLLERALFQIALSHDNLDKGLYQMALVQASEAREQGLLNMFIVSRCVHQTLPSTNAPSPRCFLGLSLMNTL